MNFFVNLVIRKLLCMRYWGGEKSKVSSETNLNKLNKVITYYLAKDMQPLYAVERSGFKKLVAKLDPKYALPSRNYFQKQKFQDCVTK